MEDAAAALEEGLAALLPAKKGMKKRKRETAATMSPENSLDNIKKGIRYAANPALACRRTVAALQSALVTVPPPLPQFIQICRCLFDRSKAFRVEMVAQLQAICRVLETKQLYTVEMLELFRAWDVQYAAAFPQLHAAVAAIPTKWTSRLKQRDEAVDAQVAAQRMLDMQFEHMEREVNAGGGAVVAHVESLERALGMLIPTVEDCFTSLLPIRAGAYESDEDEAWEDVCPPIETWSLPQVIESCGLGSAAYSITIPAPDMTSTHDLDLIRAALDEQVGEIRKRFLPQVDRWLAMAQRRETSPVCARVRHLRELLKAALAKAREVHIWRE
ncbi:Aste57867_25066 [Aphanomyces stellatus]|uniref:Aste57867_25066 protein n=1 Tax=Aphanomyces stellatus TaxID=120398 RepID=A0A485LS53_9STRA|nr:hypothetical protein As57867_024988 [Aphanomyces stellatus]VFU01697.1 Aste57867_25066 [Aphanomyces stellatus]